MKIALIINKLFISLILFILFILSSTLNANDINFSQILDNSDYSKYYFNQNNDKYIVAINRKGDDLILYKENINRYMKIYQGNNYTFDDLYVIDNISFNNNTLIINTYFNGSGGMGIRYYISNKNDKWGITKKETRYNEIKDDVLRYKICIDSNDIENCFYEITKKSYLYDIPNKRSRMYLMKGDRVVILRENNDSYGNKWYFINYKGKKDINMWIKAEAVDITE